MTRAEILQIAKPILFNTEMVRAILNGRKTMTRRAVKPPVLNTIVTHPLQLADKPGFWAFYGEDGLRRASCHTGDILYIRETWSEWTGGYLYKAWPEGIAQPGAFPGERWRPSIHMPKEAARIFLRVTDVRVERLRDISEEDVVAEGAESFIQCPREHAIIESDGTKGDMCWNTDCCKQCDYISKSYGELFGEIVWDSTLKKSDIDRYGWNANPWVWVIEFERVETD